jgi:hypothetical protein
MHGMLRELVPCGQRPTSNEAQFSICWLTSSRHEERAIGQNGGHCDPSSPLQLEITLVPAAARCQTTAKRAFYTLIVYVNYNAIIVPICA